MSRDTRLDEALERPFAVKEAITRLRGEIDEAWRGADGNRWATVVRAADLTTVLAEIDRLLLVNGQIAKLWAEAEDRAASLSVSPVPSEPMIGDLIDDFEEAVLAQDAERGSTTEARLALEAAFASRAVSPVPEPSEPPPTCGAEANIGLRNHVCGLPTGHDGEHQCAGVLSCNTTWSSGDTPK